MLGSKMSACLPHKMSITLVALILVATACGETDDNSAASSPSNAADSDDLVSLMRSIGESFDFDTHDSPAILGDEASLTVIGTVTSVADGGRTRARTLYRRLSHRVCVHR